MYKYILTFLSFFLFQFCFAQDKQLDSIESLLKNDRIKDSVRVKNLIYYTLFTTVADDSKTLSALNEALAISKEIGYKEGLGNIYSAFTHYYVRKGNYKEAIIQAEKAKQVQEKNNDIAGIISTNTSIANIYNHLDNPGNAIAILKENLILVPDNDPGKAKIYFYLAKAYQTLGDYNSAEMHYNAAKNIAISTNFITGVAIANSSLGTLKIKKGEYDEGISLLEKSLTFFSKNNQTINMAHSYIEMAEAYKKIGKIDEAIALNNKAILIYEEQGILKNLKIAYLNQSNSFDLKGDYQKSIFYLKEHYKIKDSIFSKDNIKVIDEMQIKYETEKIRHEKEVAEKQISITKLESQQNKNLFLGSISIAVLLLLSSFFYFRNLKIKKTAEIVSLELKETQKRLALEKQYKNSELKALKAQMNPHFIFNVLNSIQEYILLNKKNLASDYLGKFADLIRNYLHYSNTGLISIHEEVKNINLYLELEKLRFEDNLNYTISVDNNINSDITYIPTMIVQPYIENALKHGLLHKITNRNLKIIFSKISENLIKCEVIDDGVGRVKSKLINKKSNKNHKSFALKATAERLELLNFGKDKKIGVVIKDVKSSTNEIAGTQVILTIPITKNI